MPLPRRGAILRLRVTGGLRQSASTSGARADITEGASAFRYSPSNTAPLQRNASRQTGDAGSDYDRLVA
jgi:hypothetical protein